MPTSRLYTIERVREIAPYGKIAEFFYQEAPNVEKIFDHRFAWAEFDISSYALHHCVWVCLRAGIPVGIMMAQLFPSIWDGKKVLMQNLLYCKKSSGRAAYLLMKEFIDFGRAEASLVFTMTTKNTNVKEKSLQRLGFKKVEEHFLLEV